ncbi:hypothetical protein ISG33_02080 [Glaciecola sp. MH2013]|uniref:hypothetical protein n=1 Tax=Glaciecola sp. MH2013 TaxID=2785524 RepID=UPI00189D00C4|nr:hypothetical protein [Glaciecola sp. MH2013]MBF7072190.1 hypothetical protein [Glaciecola sp. MH2013]
MSDQHPSQTNIFNLAEQYPNVAELCNALYERELVNLASSNISDPILLKRKLSGLSYHIKNAAEFLINEPTPIDVDVHNGTWKSKQAGKCPATKLLEDEEVLGKTEAWFNKHSYHGAVVCIYVNDYGNEHIEFDSIDMLPTPLNKLHTNKHGWFALNGKSLEAQAKHVSHQLVKPNKAIVGAACSGHTWNSKGKTSPRALSLRELLLSTNINWKTFK